eukprot:713525-Rhodomonas_salina.1
MPCFSSHYTPHPVPRQPLPHGAVPLPLVSTAHRVSHIATHSRTSPVLCTGTGRFVGCCVSR